MTVQRFGWHPSFPQATWYTCKRTNCTCFSQPVRRPPFDEHESESNSEGALLLTRRKLDCFSESNPINQSRKTSTIFWSNVQRPSMHDNKSWIKANLLKDPFSCSKEYNRQNQAQTAKDEAWGQTSKLKGQSKRAAAMNSTEEGIQRIPTYCNAKPALLLQAKMKAHTLQSLFGFEIRKILSVDSLYTETCVEGYQSL